MRHPPELRQRILAALAQNIPLQVVRDRYRTNAGDKVSERAIYAWIADQATGSAPGAYEDKFAAVEAAHPASMQEIAVTIRERYSRKMAPEFETLPPLPPLGIRIAAIGDMQVKPKIPLDYCRWIGMFIAKEKPDVIVNIGDFADMPSCSFHEQAGSKTYSDQNYRADILSVHEGMKLLMTPIQEEMARSGWAPRLVMCLGNHEDRINRLIEAIPKLDGTIGLPDLEYERWGWEVYPFLQPVEIAGVHFCHYFPSGQMGRPISSARAMINKLHVSCFAGHQQGRDFAPGKRGDGKQITAIICGSSYLHNEKYLNFQTNNHWRGFYFLNDVVDGEFEEQAVSMKHLRRKYGE